MMYKVRRRRSGGRVKNIRHKSGFRSVYSKPFSRRKRRR